MKILVVNCGSSSIKYQLFEMPQRLVLGKGLVERIGESGSALNHTSHGQTVRQSAEVATHEQGLELALRTLTEGAGRLLERIDEIDAVGHRVVHGADEFTGSVLIKPDVLAAIEREAHLAPLHNPPNLAGIRASQRALPHAAQVACFDTAFHSTLPPVAYTYAWYKNGVLQTGLTGSTVDAAYTGEGQTWRCVVTAGDGAGGTASSYDQVTTGSTLPGPRNPGYVNSVLTYGTGWRYMTNATDRNHMIMAMTDFGCNVLELQVDSTVFAKLEEEPANMVTGIQAFSAG